MGKKMLPDKPSELIRLALADLEKVEADERYCVRMGIYHSQVNMAGGSLCGVCLAGSVMAKTLGAPITERVSTDDFIEGAKLEALDYFRCGDTAEGLIEMGIIDSPDECPIDAVSSFKNYDEDPDQFKADMHQLADDLEAAGL